MNFKDPRGLFALAGDVIQQEEDGDPQCDPTIPPGQPGSCYPTPGRFAGDQQGGPGAGSFTLDQILGHAWTTAHDLRTQVGYGNINDCEALARFADEMAGIANTPAEFVKSFSVMVGQNGASFLGVGWNSAPQYLKPPGSTPSGFGSTFQDGYGSIAGANNSDQAHHFAAFLELGFSVGYPAAYVSAWAYEKYEGTPDNAGDVNLGRAAAYIGATIGTLTMPKDVGGLIRKDLCAH